MNLIILNIISYLKKNYKLVYTMVSIVLIIISPIMFLCFNVFALCGLIYYRINYKELFRINLFLLIIWFLLFSCYSYLLTHEPTIPLSSGSVMLNPGNLVLIISYSAKFPSLCRATFVETLVLIYMMSSVLGYYPTIYIF